MKLLNLNLYVSCVECEKKISYIRSFEQSKFFYILYFIVTQHHNRKNH